MCSKIPLRHERVQQDISGFLLRLVHPIQHACPNSAYWKHNSDLMKPVKRPLFQKDLDLVTPLDLVPMYLISYA